METLLLQLGTIQIKTTIHFIYDVDSQYIYENTELQKIATVYFELIGDNTEMITESDFQSTLLNINGGINSDVFQNAFVFTSFSDTMICHLDPTDYISDIRIENTDVITYIRNLDSSYFKTYEIEGLVKLQG